MLINQLFYLRAEIRDWRATPHRESQALETGGFSQSRLIVRLVEKHTSRGLIENGYANFQRARPLAFRGWRINRRTAGGSPAVERKALLAVA
jgi:hypothetical protein